MVPATLLAAFLVRASLLLAALAGPWSIAAVGWPVEKPVITGTFGEDRGDHFNHGLDIGVAGQAVHPALDGELVFRWDGTQDFSSLPRGTGDLVVLRHSQNILSVYSHLAEDTLGTVRTTYTAADTLGLVGDTGRAEAPHLQFSVYDLEARSWVNPLAFLPPATDRQLPVIRRVLLAVGDLRQALQTGARVKEGRSVVLAEAYDLREDVRFHWPLAPYLLRLALDGTEVARIAFDTLSERAGRMALGPASSTEYGGTRSANTPYRGSGLTRNDLYAGDGLLKLGSVDLHPGESRLQLAVRDFAGNETARELVLTVGAQH